MNMKKLSALILVVVMLLSVMAGCKTSTETTPNTTVNQNQPTNGNNGETKPTEGPVLMAIHGTGAGSMPDGQFAIKFQVIAV